MPDSEPSVTSSLTPLLDSGLLPPVVRRKGARAAIRAVPGFIVGFVLMVAVSAQADKARNPIFGLVLLVSALWSATVIHELGHLVAGWMVGFRFSRIHIGPFSLSMEQGRLKARVRREMLALGSAGMHVMTVRRLRRRLLIHVAGGPAANILSIPIAVLLVNNVLPSLGETRVGNTGGAVCRFLLASRNGEPYADPLPPPVGWRAD